MHKYSQIFTHGIALVLTTVLLVGCGGKEERIGAYMERGKAYFAEENYTKANIEFKNALQIDPKVAEAAYFVGFIAEKQRDWRKAFNNYQRASRLDENMIEPRIHLARIYMSQAGALQARGDMTAKANAVALAQEHITKILEIDPENTETLALAAVMLGDSGETEKALVQLKEIIGKNPGQRSAAMVLSRMYEDNGLLEKAVEVLNEALTEGSENESDRTDLQLALVQFYARQKDMINVMKQLQQMVSENPEVALYRDLQVTTLASNNRVDEAEDMLRDHIKSDPKDVQRYFKLTTFLIANRDKATARDELKAVVAERPELAEIRLALAGMYLEEKDTNSARAVLEMLIEKHEVEPTALKARSVLAQLIFVEDEASERVGELIAVVLKENPSDNAALLLQGKISAVRKDFIEAIANFRAVLKDQPNSPEVLRLLAAAHNANKEPELARDTLLLGLDRNPTNSKLRMALVGMLIQENDIERALREIEAVLETDKFNEQALAVKFQLLAQKGDVAGLDLVTKQMQEGSPDDEAGYFREVQIRVAQKDYAAANELLDHVLSTKPDSLPALTAKSHVLDKLQKYDEALVVVRQMQKVLPDSPEGYYREAMLLEKKQDLSGALKKYEQAYSRKPDSSEVLMSIAKLEVRMGDRDAAEKRLKAVLADDSAHKSAYNVLGLLYVSEKKFTQAEQAFESQLKIAPETQEAYSQLASTRIAQKNLEGAVKAYKDGLAQFENDVLMMIGFAGVRERQGFQEDAIGLYERVLEQQPGNAISVNNLASLLSDYRTDTKSMQRAKELAQVLKKTSQPAFRDTAGWIYFRQGDYQQAVEILSSVVVASPNVPVFNYHLGMAMFKAGDKAGAKRYLIEATSKDVKFPGAEEARATLESL